MCCKQQRGMCQDSQHSVCSIKQSGEARGMGQGEGLEKKQDQVKVATHANAT